MPGKCTFRENWVIDDPDMAKWLRPVDNEKYKAYCLFCKSKFDVSHNGMFAVKSHQQGKKHKELFCSIELGKQKILTFSKVREIKSNVNDLEPDLNQAKLLSSTDALKKDSHSVANYMTGDEVTKAEILWALNKIVTHSSDRGCAKSSNIFALMFPDSLIAKKFQMQKDKLSYVITYGLGPFFQEQLAKELKMCDFFCVSIDESLNKISQKGQMDIVIRYWNYSSKCTATRYLTSAFLGKSTAVDLLNALTESVESFGLTLNKILQISVDGPNVNLKFLKDFQYVMEINNPQIDHQKLMDTGTCALHVIHNGFKVAHKSSSWHINKFLRSLYYLFKDFPSRRAVYSDVTGSEIFPLKLCTIRWIENSSVMERALKMIPFLKIYVDKVKSNPPDSKNFHKIVKSLEDRLLVAKLSFMQSIASELESFLTCFQSERPLFPFLYTELFRIIKNIGGRFLKKEIVKDISKASDFKNIDIKKLINHVPIQAINIGFGAAFACKTAKDADIQTFRRQCKEFLIVLLEKFISPKSPFVNKFVRGASSLSPAVMLNSTLNSPRITLLLNELIAKNHVAPIEADKIKEIYLECTHIMAVRTKLEKFDWKKDRLDLVFEELFNSEEKLPFLKFSQKILTLFHGNAAVERSFSINKECLVENLNEHSLIAQRSIYSAISSYGGYVENVPITRTMILEVKKSSMRRKEALKLQKQKCENEKMQRNKVQKELVNLKERKRKLMEETEEETRELKKQIAETEKKLKQF